MAQVVKKIKTSTVAPKPGLGLNTWMIAGFLFFTVPMFSAFVFSVQVGDGTYTLSAYSRMISDPGFGEALWISAKLAVLTVAIAIGIMVPTVTWLHIRAQRAKRIVEFITLLPLIIPPVVIALGFLGAMPLWLKDSVYMLVFAYVVLSMPYTFRSLDTGLSAIDVKTLVDAARGLGASWRQVMVSIIGPNIKSAIFGAIFLTVALVLGEFVISNLLLWSTLPVWMALVGMADAEGAVALSVMSLVFVWMLLMLLSSLDRRRKVRVNIGGLS
jgi:putative spermidine/putrescine transport system permease protein